MEKIKQLREASGAGMVECKKALDESAGDLDKAIAVLRKKGIAKAAKRVDRETNEGVIKTILSDDKKQAYMLELNSETDFVARNEKFQGFADQVLAVAKNKNIDNLETLLQSPLDSAGTVQENLDNLSGTIGEKMGIKRLASLRGETVAAYTHLGGKIGVLIALDQPGLEDLATDIAMQVAAANPKYLQSGEVSEEEIAAEKEIYRAQLLKEGKPEAMIDKIMEGKIIRYYSEVCLLEQEFIKDEKQKIKNILGSANILGFVRFNL